jgi:hypothetical protein
MGNFLTEVSMGVAEDVARFVMAADNALNAQTTLLAIYSTDDGKHQHSAHVTVAKGRLETALAEYHVARAAFATSDDN